VNITMRVHSQLPIAAALLSALVSACTYKTADASGGAEREILVTAAEFAFRAVDTIPAGLTRVLFLNKGRERHHLQLVRLEEGHTIQDLLDQMSKGNLTPSWVTFVGGPSVPPPGGASEVTVRLAPGQYAMLCFISSKDHVPHLMKGMLRPLTVTPSQASSRGEPHADVRMVLDDYSFTFAPALRAGRRTIRVENAAAQPHEVFIVRPASGKTVEDMRRWVERPEGPPPIEPVGGAMALTRGAVNFLTAEFAPGDYSLVCYVPDAKDGKPHLAHGMIRFIRVE
jgi:hypothetical protein